MGLECLWGSNLGYACKNQFIHHGWSHNTHAGCICSGGWGEGVWDDNDCDKEGVKRR
jgi:hypothetical protein